MKKVNNREVIKRCIEVYEQVLSDIDKAIANLSEFRKRVIINQVEEAYQALTSVKECLEQFFKQHNKKEVKNGK